MKPSGFFDGVAQYQVPWRGTTFPTPTFYQDVGILAAAFMAPLDRVSALLPSKRLHPWRPTPWHGVVYIAAFEYRESDIGPYNEVMIAIPASVDHPSPVFTGLLREAPAEADAYIVHLPVTTEIAMNLGIEALGLPKFLADIEFKEEGDWVSSRLSKAGQHILTLAVRKGKLQTVPRSRSHLIGARGGRLLRSLAISAEGEQSVSKNPGDVKIELGEHRISQQLRDLGLGRIVLSEFAPSMELILTLVQETFAA